MGVIDNLELGPCVVKYGVSGAEVDLGFTMGSVTVAIETEVADVTADQLGTTILKQIITGRNATITIPFAETSIELFSKMIPLASFVQDATTATKQKTIINTPIGSDLVASASKSLLLIKSIGGTASTDANDVFRFFKAAPSGEVEFAFSVDDQRVYETEFTAYPDSTQSFAIGVFGDIAATA